jgi:hypothetical protein
MKLPLSLAKKLLLLINSNEAAYSQFNKSQINDFIEDGVIELCYLSGNKKVLKIKSLDYLHDYLFNKYNISDINQYVKILSNEDSTRSDFSLVSTNSKIKNDRVFSGFLINTYENIFGYLCDEKINLKPVLGSFIFINDSNNFKIQEDINVVVVENFENFKYIEKQKNLFDTKNNLFIWRYQNNALSEWLSEIPNKYIHFGDFDLSGLAIYLNFKQKRKYNNSSFLIPNNINELIKRHGNRDRYLKQIESTKNINFKIHKEINSLAEFIIENEKSLEQEIFININSYS